MDNLEEEKVPDNSEIEVFDEPDMQDYIQSNSHFDPETDTQVNCDLLKSDS